DAHLLRLFARRVQASRPRSGRRSGYRCDAPRRCRLPDRRRLRQRAGAEPADAEQKEPAWLLADGYTDASDPKRAIGGATTTRPLSFPERAPRTPIPLLSATGL